MPRALQALVDAYSLIRRPAGNTPFESIAILAMARSLSSGIVVEVSDLHALVLDIKRQGQLDDYISFASGNEVERMFLKIRPGILDAYRRLPAASHATPTLS